MNDTFVKNLTALPLASQEREVITELLYLFVGLEGNFISKDVANEQSNTVDFLISIQLHNSLVDLAKEIIPLASYYSAVQDLVNASSTKDEGRVSQALSAAMRSIMIDYYSSISQLETMHSKKQLTLQKLNYFLRPTIKSMQKLAQFSAKLKHNCFSSADILSLLHEHVIENSGDEICKLTFMDISNLTAEPYIEMIKLWIFQGNCVTNSVLPLRSKLNDILNYFHDR